MRPNALKTERITATLSPKPGVANVADLPKPSGRVVREAPAFATTGHSAHTCRQPGRQFEHPHQVVRQRIRSILPPMSSPHTLKRCKPRLRTRTLTHSAIATRSL